MPGTAPSASTRRRPAADARDGRVEGALELVEVAPRDVPEAFRQRLERFVLLRLPRGMQRGQCAPVERAVGADDHMPAPATVLAGQLDGRLVGLGARVAEEHLA